MQMQQKELEKQEAKESNQPKKPEIMKLTNEILTNGLPPAFKQNNVPIVYNFSKGYVPPFTICLKSAMRYYSPDKNYDIVILTRELTDEQMGVIASMVEGHDNISVRYLNPAPFFRGMKYFMADRLPLEGFFRSASPFILKQYDKLIYMDSDMLVKADLAELYDTDVSGYYLAAVQDLVAKAFLNMKDKTAYAIDYIYRAKYRMRLRDPYTFFNSGLMLLNCAEIRRDFQWQDMMNFWKGVDFKCDDQDMLNSLFQGHVKFLDLSWNLFAKTNEAFAKVYEEAPEMDYEAYLAAREHPKIVHFITEIKPWNVCQGDFVMEFWHLARNTPYYEALVEYVAGFLSQSVSSYCMYQMDYRSFDKRLKRSTWNIFKRGVNVILPLGTRRHEKVKELYFRLTGKDYIAPFEIEEYENKQATESDSLWGLE